MKALLYWILELVSGLSAIAGALLVGWNVTAWYYLATGRVRAGFEQPPATVAVASLVLGLVLLFAGWLLHRRLRNNDAFTLSD